jgi:AraC family transcriptional regulator, positive regulator of tynA and feaB
MSCSLPSAVRPDEELQEFQRSLTRVYGQCDPHGLEPTQDRARGQLNPHTLGPFDATWVSLASIRVHRAGMQDWTDYAFALLQRNGRAVVAQAGNRVEILANDVVLIDSRTDFEMVVNDSCDLVAFHIAREQLATVSASDYGRRIAGDIGVGYCLSRLLQSLIESHLSLDDEDCIAVAESVTDLTARALARRASVSPGASAEFLELRAWALAHLDDPLLGPGRLVAASGMSRRQVYRLFASHGSTPRCWLKDLRLEQARTRLMRADACSRSIADVAYSVGFSDAAHFSRAFKQRFGVSPSSVRRPAAQAPSS